MNTTVQDLDSISSEKLLILAKDLLRKKNLTQAKNCFDILVNRNPLDFFSRFHQANLLRYQLAVSNSQAMKDTKTAFFKILADFPDIIHTPKDFSLFFVKLAEILYETGQLDDAESAYGFIVRNFQYPAHIFKYAELLSIKNIADPNITLLLQNAINVDPGKLLLKNELFKLIIKNRGNLTPEKINEIASRGFKFSNGWFHGNISRWDKFIPQKNPRKILEVGSFEGQSICYLIEKLSDGTNLEIHSIDTWEGGIEHQAEGEDMTIIEDHFDYNVKLASKNKANIKIYKHKGFSDELMPKMLASGMKNYFDLVYIDGSHLASDVLSDAIMGFRLLRVGGLLGFDDYLLNYLPEMNRSPLENPKPAIDAFTNIYFKKIEILPDLNFQLWIKKISD
jgi:predicted O-methyltransferase YrrM